MGKVDEIMQGIKENRVLLAQKYVQLERSLAIQKLWPGVFELGGKVTSYWHGHPKAMLFTVKMTRVDGTFVEHHYTYAELPAALQATLTTEARLHLNEHERKQQVMQRFKGGA